MANHADAIKRAKQNDKRRTRNRHFRTRMRNEIKALRAAIEAGDKPAADEQLKTAISTIHSVCSKGIIHRNQAARRISRLNKAVKTMGA